MKEYDDLAEQEIINRLVKSLLDENKDFCETKIHSFASYNDVLIFEEKNMKSLLLICKKKSRIKSIISINKNGKLKSLGFLQLLKHILDFWSVPIQQRGEIIKEVLNSYENLRNSFYWEKQNLFFIQNKIQNIIECSSSDEEVEKSFQISESLPFKGHPLHVCTKTKIGFSEDEIYQYCPEFFCSVNIPLIYIKKDYITEYGNDYKWKKYLKESLDINIKDDEVVFPIHPWHLKKMVIPGFSNEIKKGIITLTNSSVQAFPTLSLRTHSLPMNTHGNSLHIKLPIAIQATSVFRLLSERDIYNGIIFSKYISSISTDLESIISGKAFIVEDKYGAHFKEAIPKFLQGPQLSFCVRESPCHYIKNGKLVVAAALTHYTAHNSEPLLTQLCKKSEITIIKYLELLFEIILHMPLEIFLKYGIALDVHGQNCLINFDQNYLPVAFVYRDLGSIQIVADFEFSEKIRNNLVDPNKTILDYQDCINELFHSLYFNLLADLVEMVDEYYDIDPNFTWEMIKNTSLSIIASIDCPNQHKERLKTSLLSNKLPKKELLKMRLQGKTSFNFITNPLVSSFS